MKFVVRKAIFFAFLLLIPLYVYLHREDFKVLLEVNVGDLAILLLCNVFFFATIGRILCLLVLPFKVYVGLFEGLFLALVSTFGNYFLPFRGGSGLRAVYLKTTHKLKYRDFFATLLFQLVLMVNFSSFIGLLCTFTVTFGEAYTHTLLQLLFLGLFLATASLFWIKRRFVRILPSRSLRKRTLYFLRAWRRIAKHRLLLPKLYGAHMLFYLANVLMVWSELVGLGLIDIVFSWGSLSKALVISAFNLMSSVLFITPGALGVREMMMAGIAGGVSIRPNSLIALSLYDRCVTILLIFLLLPVLAMRFRIFFPKRQ